MLNLEVIQIELCRERQELMLRAQVRVETSKGDEADIAAMSQNKAQTMWLAEDAKQKMAAIDKALLRIEQGNYGACVQCAKGIPDERLMAMPLTLYCVDCQTQLERTRKK